VKGTARPNSDLDLVIFTSAVQRPQVSELKDAIDESNIPFRVDLHVWDDIPERFHDIIRREYQILEHPLHPEDNPSGLTNRTTQTKASSM
jgi:predicted nucleotidyltransferase